MIDKEIMLLLGTALMETARHRIKISRNIFGLGHLCSGTEFERLDKKKELELIKTQFNDINLNYALKAWRLGSGYCGELALIIAYLSCHIKINCKDKIYLSVISLR